MRLYHGTAAYAAILANGFDPECVGRNFDEEAGGLQTHAGVYLTDDPEKAASYASRILEPTPSLLVLDVDAADLIPDEDVLAFIARYRIDPRLYQSLRDRIADGEGASDLDGYDRYIDAFMEMAGIDPTGPNLTLTQSYVALLAEADVDDTCSAEFIQATIDIARVAGHLVRPEWCAGQDLPYSVRIIDSQPRILGRVTLHLEDNGLAIVGDERSGDVTEVEAESFLGHLVACLAEENPDFAAAMPSRAIVVAV